ncbi:MAG: hypothetical protein LBD90_01630 [Bifidobacteriaceae bacterium]|jgi:hypothetical protein|nr:hypothetical protein [Bifidobacteriaceae bacterium]
MRTTVDLPPGAHRRAKRLATASGRSLSQVLAELVAVGLASADEPPPDAQVNPTTGLLTFDLGRSFSSEDVAELIDDDR